MKIFIKGNMVKGHYRSLPRHISGLLVLVFLFASIGGIGTSVFFSPALAQAQGSEKGILHRHHPLVREAIDVQHRHHGWLMRIPDVVGTGVGIGPDGLPAIKVFTARHGVKGIPEWLESTPTQVEVTGRFYALRDNTCDATGDGICTAGERWPLPVPTGVSVGHPAITAGTIAARVKRDNEVFVLSNNHVLANVNQAGFDDPILQPGTYDGGINPDDAIGNLTDYEQIKFCTVFWIWIMCDETNTIDAAIAKSDPSKLGVSTPTGQYKSIAGYGAPSSTLHPAYGVPGTIGDENLANLLGIGVQKYGRTTGMTTGSINTINATVDVCYDADCVNIARFTDQLIVTPGTFSAGGDSGSLVIDDQRRPVGLLFAGSDTQTIINRIDLVLNRFGVTIDDGAGTTPPTPPAAPSNLTATAASSSQINLTWAEDSDNESGFKIEGCTGANCSEFAQIGTVGANVTSYSDKALSASTTYTYRVRAYNAGGDSDYSNEAVATTEEAPSGPQLQVWNGLAYTDHWTTVDLGDDYGDEMVVVCSPNYDLSAPGPAIVRVRNASGSSFEVGLGRPWYGTFGGEDFSANVYCMVVRQGVYTLSEGGVKMEAVKLPGFTLSDHVGSWSGQPQSYQNSYSKPVVVGQVVSSDTGIPPSYCPDLLCELDWSVFWSRGTAVTNPPSTSALYVGRHTGEDPNARNPETLVYVVIESGTGTIEGLKYVAGLGKDSVRGMQNRPPFTYSFSGLSSASAAIVSQAGMDGGDGGWAVLYGPSAVSATRLRLAIDEDWYLYSERSHTTEQVSYIVFE